MKLQFVSKTGFAKEQTRRLYDFLHAVRVRKAWLENTANEAVGVLALADKLDRAPRQLAANSTTRQRKRPANRSHSH